MSLNTILATAPNTTSGYILKATGTSIGNSLIQDNGTNVSISSANTTLVLDTTSTSYDASLRLNNNSSATSWAIMQAGPAAVSGGGLNTYTTGAYPMIFGTNSTERLRITNTGVVLLNTSTSIWSNGTTRGVLEINGTTQSLLGFDVGGSGAGYIYHDGTNMTIQNALAGYLRLNTDGTERVRISSTGVVTVNQALATYGAMSVKGNTDAYSYGGFNIYNNTGVNFLSLAIGTTRAVIGADYAAGGSYMPMDFETGNTIRMRIFANGAISMGQNVLSISGFIAGSLSGPFGSIGATSRQTQGIAWGTYSTSSGLPNYMANWNSPNFWGIGTHSGSGDSTVRIGVVASDANGAYWTGGYANIYAGSYTNGSDYRMKENINSIESVLDKVLNLNPVRYNIKDIDDRENLTKEDIGFIAHEVQEYFPEFVYGSKDQVDVEGTPIHQGLDYAKMVAVLTKAIQELNQKVTQQQEQINQLINK